MKILKILQTLLHLHWIQIFQINFPAVTVCPELKTKIDILRGFTVYYEKHSLRTIPYEYEEFLTNFSDELRLNMSKFDILYLDIFKSIENGSINVNKLGIKL